MAETRFRKLHFYTQFRDAIVDVFSLSANWALNILFFKNPSTNFDSLHTGLSYLYYCLCFVVMLVLLFSPNSGHVTGWWLIRDQAV